MDNLARKVSPLLLGRIMLCGCIVVALMVDLAVVPPHLRYRAGVQAMERRDWSAAQVDFRALGTYRNSPALLKESYYQATLESMAQRKWPEAADRIHSLEHVDAMPSYRDMPQRVQALPELAALIADRQQAAWMSGQVQSNSMCCESDAIALSANGRTLVQTVSEGRNMSSVSIVDMASGQRTRSHSTTQEISVSADGTRVMVGGQMYRITPISEPLMIDGAQRGAFHPTQAVYVGIDGNKHISIWDIDPRYEDVWHVIAAPKLGELAAKPFATQVSFSPDGRWLATMLEDGTVLVWTFGEPEPRLHLGEARSFDAETRLPIPYVLAFSDDGELLASSADSADVQIWRVRDGALLQTLASPATVTSLAFRHDGVLLAVGTAMLPGAGSSVQSGSGKIALWCTDTWRQVGALDGGVGDVTGLAWMPDNNWLISSGYAHDILIWSP